MDSPRSPPTIGAIRVYAKFAAPPPPPPLPQDDLPSLLLSISEEIKTLNLRVKSIEDRLPFHVHVPSRVPSHEEEEDEGEEEDILTRTYH